MKKRNICKAALPLLLSFAMLAAAGCGEESSSASSAAQQGTATASSQQGGKAESSSQQASQTPPTAVPTAEPTPAVTEAPTEEPTPEPTPVTELTPPPEENLPDGTVHTPLTPVGSVFITENKAYSPYYFASSSGDAYAAMLNTVAAALPGVRTSSILAPTSMAVCLGDEIQATLECSDEAWAIEYTYSMVAEPVTAVRILDTLKRHNAEYLFFGTDHHWTQLGAYYAYRDWCYSTGRVPHELAEYQQMVNDGFLGLFYYYSDYSDILAANPDTVYAYIPIGTNDMTIIYNDGEQYPSQVVRDMSAEDSGTKYSAFIGGDQPLCAIHNPGITDGSACILIKDSFGNAFAPFLVDHFENVYVVDYRYYEGNLTAFAQEHGVTDLVILTNVDEILQSTADTILAMF